MHHLAKFRQYRLNRGRHGDFSIFQDGGRPPSWICGACVGITHKGHLVVFITMPNLVGIDAVVRIICTFFDFASLPWKRLSTPQNCLWWFWPPKWGAMCMNKSKKAHPCVKIRWRVWTVGEFLKKGAEIKIFLVIFHPCAKKPHWHMCTKSPFGTAVEVADVITCASYLVIVERVSIL